MYARGAAGYAEELEDLLGYAKEGTVRESYALAKSLKDASEAEQEAAKAGLGTVGSTLVDASVAGVEMLMDNTAGSLSGVGSMGMMLIRSMAVKLAKLPADMFEEGLEEVIGDLLDPAVNGAANAIDGGTRDTALPTRAELRHSFNTGALLSGWGHAVEDVSGVTDSSSTQITNDVMQNIHAILPNISEAEAEAYYEMDAERMGENTPQPTRNESKYRLARAGESRYN